MATRAADVNGLSGNDDFVRAKARAMLQGLG